MLHLAYLTARAAFDKQLMAVMQSCFATRFGPEPFSAMLSELHHLDHARRELMYLSALRSSASQNSRQPEPFSQFDDKLRFAGSTPSAGYCKGVFVDWMRVHRPFFDRAISSLPGTILKADASYKVRVTNFIILIHLMLRNLGNQIHCPA